MKEPDVVSVPFGASRDTVERLVERLRGQAPQMASDRKLCDEAADEIERLRIEIASNPHRKERAR